MRTSFLVAALTVMVCGAAVAETIETPSVRLVYPNDYRHSMEGNTFLLSGPSGEKFRISVMRRKGSKDDGGPSVSQLMSNTKAHMERFGARGDLIFVRPVAESKHSTGTPLNSAASFSNGRRYFFLQYATANDAALVYLTFEGVGDLETATK